MARVYNYFEVFLLTIHTVELAEIKITKENDFF